MLGAHHAVGSAVGFAGDDGDLGNGGFGKGVEQFGAVHDDAAVLLLNAGQEAGNVFEGHQRNVEAVAEANEARGLDGGVDVEHAGEEVGLVGDDADGASVEAGKADDDVLGVVLLHLEEVAVIDHAGDDVLDVVGLVALGGNHGVELVRRRGRWGRWWACAAARRDCWRG